MFRTMTWTALSVLGCTDLTMPVREEGKLAVVSPTGAPAAATASGAQPAEQAPRQRLRDEERVGASHILVAYKGARRARAEVTRTKRQAKERAEEARAKAVQGEDFAALAREYSDDPSASKGGSLGSFAKNAMVKPFADAAFGLKVGEISKIVETEFGFHVIRRTQ